MSYPIGVQKFDEIINIESESRNIEEWIVDNMKL